MASMWGESYPSPYAEGEAPRPQQSGPSMWGESYPSPYFDSWTLLNPT